MRRTVAPFALAALALALTSPLAAQGRRDRGDHDRDRGLVELPPESVRGGFFITGSLGAGREQYKFADEIGYSDGLTKPTIQLRLGGTPNANVRVGGELFGWANDIGDGTEGFVTGLITAQAYPMKNGGLFLKAGGGIAGSGTDFDDPSVIDPHETGFAWSVGAGYDIQLGKQFSLGPTIDFYQASFTKRNEPTLYERVLHIGVQVTFQTGGRDR